MLIAGCRVTGFKFLPFKAAFVAGTLTCNTLLGALGTSAKIPVLFDGETRFVRVISADSPQKDVVYITMEAA